MWKLSPKCKHNPLVMMHDDECQTEKQNGACIRELLMRWGDGIHVWLIIETYTGKMV